VGVLVGGLVAALTAVLLVFLPQTSPLSPLVAAVLGTVFSVMLTGAFHEDGLADIADGLGGTTGGVENRERALEIMKDSRVGAFGTIAVALVLLAKVALLALIGDVNPEALVVGIFAAHVASRTFPLLLIRLLPHVGDVAGSKSKPLADQISGYSLSIAFIWLIMALFICLADVLSGYDAINLAATLVAASIAFLYMWRLFAKRLQGFTGDCLGATQQVCEVAFYLGLALSLA
jgi:adenosylcobinamide-GDP ribazoletransferase